MTDQSQTTIEQLEARVAEQERRIEHLEHTNERQDTLLNAADQAIAAFRLADQSKKASTQNREVLKELNRKLNVVVCMIVGAFSVYATKIFTEPPEAQRMLAVFGISSALLGLMVLLGFEKMAFDWVNRLVIKYTGGSIVASSPSQPTERGGDRP